MTQCLIRVECDQMRGAETAPRPRGRRGDAASLSRKIEFLKRAESYPDRPRRVTAIETHMSWIFLTDRYAYKLKKPVRLPFLDFGTIEARRRNCERELRLNRRLAPDVYLAVVPLRATADGRLSLGDKGRIVDWLVKMRRLSGDRTLQHAIRHESVRAADLRRFVELLVGFYRSTDSAPISETRYRQRFEENIKANRLELAKRAWHLPTGIIRDVTKAQLDFVIHEPRLLAQRVRDRRIVEGHGDLRPEHVYLGATPVVTDCLEFNRAFRILDPADELAYLALECDMLGSHETGRRIIELYRELSGDTVPERLLDFYMSERACLRAKLAIWHLREQDARRPAKWRRRALKYLRLARSYALALSQRVMISDPGQSLDLKKLYDRAARVKPLDRRREKRR